MKTLEQLVNREEAGWSIVLDWISKASRPCEILAPSIAHRDDVLIGAQVSTRSPMGAIIYESAALLIDNGWLRILGSGNNSRIKRSLSSWNQGKMNGYCLMADDAIGGFFALNGGAFGNDLGNVYYLAPDTLEWEPCKMTYSQFIVWSLGPSLDKFYEGLRWPGWQGEAKALSGDAVFFFYPPLFAKGPPLAERNRGSSPVVPIEEQFRLAMDFRRQMLGKS